MDNKEMFMDIKQLVPLVQQCPCCIEWLANMLKTTRDFLDVQDIETNESIEDYDKKNKLEMALTEIEWDLENLGKIFREFEDGKCKVKKSTTPR